MTPTAHQSNPRACPACKGECVQFVSSYTVALPDRTVRWANLAVLCPVCGGEGVLDVPTRPAARRNGELLN